MLFKREQSVYVMHSGMPEGAYYNTMSSSALLDWLEMWRMEWLLRKVSMVSGIDTGRREHHSGTLKGMSWANRKANP